MNHLGPKTHVSLFKRSITPPNIDIPTEENPSSIKDIWAATSDLAPVWEKRKADSLKSRKKNWETNAKTASPIPFRLLEELLANYNNFSKTAIDLGCGKGDLTKTLLDKGWTVIAVDYSPKVLKILSKAHPAEIKSGQLKIIEKSINKYTPDLPVDLVVCRNVLTYINPKKFQALWERIHKSFLKESGYLIGTIFTKSSHPSQIIPMKAYEDLGAWFLPDFRMARPLLTNSGYTIHNCALQLNTPHIKPEDQIIIQFSAEKKSI